MGVVAQNIRKAPGWENCCMPFKSAGTYVGYKVDPFAFYRLWTKVHLNYGLGGGASLKPEVN